MKQSLALKISGVLCKIELGAIMKNKGGEED
jgi:hypothetical protein